jgi:hypothetical protein
MPTSQSHQLHHSDDGHYESPIATFPDFDKGLGTKRACLCALVLGLLGGVACCTAAGFVWQSSGDYNLHQAWPSGAVSSGGAEVLFFAINLCIALCTDGMAYVHDTSLRWSLYHEGQPHFNTNIRLFTSARHSVVADGRTGRTNALLNC